MKRRILWADYAKGMSITLVVLYHAWAGIDRRAGEIAVQPGLYDAVNPLFQAVRMPLFFFIAGMFAVGSMRRDWSEFIAGKARALLWPYLVWSLVQSLIGWGLARMSGGQPPVALGELPGRLLFAPLDQFWFLYVLFLALLAFYALFKLLRAGWPLLLVGVLLLIAYSNVDFSSIGVAWSDRWISLSDFGPFFQLLQFFIYMALGAAAGPALVAAAAATTVRSAAAVAAGGALAVVLAVHGLGVERDTTAEFAGVVWPLGLPVALLAIAACLGLAVVFERTSSFPIILLFGRYSLYLFVLHVIICAAVRKALLMAGIDTFAIHLLAGCAGGLLLPVAVARLAAKFGLVWLFSLTGRS